MSNLETEQLPLGRIASACGCAHKKELQELSHIRNPEELSRKAETQRMNLFPGYFNFSSRTPDYLRPFYRIECHPLDASAIKALAPPYINLEVVPVLN